MGPLKAAVTVVHFPCVAPYQHFFYVIDSKKITDQEPSNPLVFNNFYL